MLIRSPVAEQGHALPLSPCASKCCQVGSCGCEQDVQTCTVLPPGPIPEESYMLALPEPPTPPASLPATMVRKQLREGHACIHAPCSPAEASTPPSPRTLHGAP